MSQPLVTVTDGATLLAPAFEYLRSRDVRVSVLPTGTTAGEVAALSRGSIAVIVHELPIQRDTIECLTGTRLIVRSGAGYNTVDIEAAAEHGMWVANVPDYCVDEVADHTLMLLLAISRRLRAMESEARSGPWVYRGTLVSTGAGVALPFFILAKVRRVKTVYVEVFDRIDSPTLTGRLCHPFADLFLVQWEAQEKLYRRSRTIGPLL